MQIDTILSDEAKMQEIAGVIALTITGLAYRRYLRKTLILAGVNEKLAKRIPTSVAAAAAIATTTALTFKRIDTQAYPDHNSPLASVTPLRPVS